MIQKRNREHGGSRAGILVGDHLIGGDLAVVAAQKHRCLGEVLGHGDKILELLHRVGPLGREQLSGKLLRAVVGHGDSTGHGVGDGEGLLTRDGSGEGHIQPDKAVLLAHFGVIAAAGCVLGVLGHGQRDLCE